jgi:hypothetical protein
VGYVPELNFNNNMNLLYNSLANLKSIENPSKG